MQQFEALKHRPDAQTSIHQDLTLFRRVGGHEVDKLYGRLAHLASQTSGIELPTDSRTGEVSPRAVLIKPKELFRNKRTLGLPRNHTALREALKDELPILTTSRIGVIERLDRYTSKNGETYLQLYFDEDTTHELGEERADMWDCLQRVSGQERELDWRAYDPDMRLAFFASHIPLTVITHIEKFVRKQLPMHAALAPVFEPQDQIS